MIRLVDREVEKVEQRLLLGGEVVRPECGERLVVVDEPEQVVDAPLLVLEVQRVALEVEVDVAGVGGGQVADHRRLVQHERRGGVRVVARNGGRLQRRLRLQLRVGARRQRAVLGTIRGGGERLDAQDARLT